VFDNFFAFLKSQAETFTVHFIGGEPFLYPRFFEMCERVVVEGHNVALTTNFSMSDHTLEKFLNFTKEHLSYFEISVHLQQIQNIDVFYEKLLFCKKMSGLDFNDFRIFSVLTVEGFESLVQLKNNPTRLGFELRVQRKTIFLGHQEYSDE